ncbi:hypothetical protein OUZ56_012472 [Daphnia magna]|uniref:Uncharacterized protein n=1 Tax=Daphnia magna TaxID=35525 RepID=A0ABQ9Z340_9CRUS|nr:hypothetical protein OUZ56_012472 [Daphnia magna]
MSDRFRNGSNSNIKLTYNHSWKFKRKITSLQNISGAPARQFLKAITGHGGYGGCERCSQTSEYDLVYRSLAFPELVDVFLGTDATFRNQVHKNHLKGNSPLLDLKINMV